MLTKTEIKSLKSLQLKKYRDETQSFLVEGKRSVEEAINHGHGIDVVLLSHDLADSNNTLIKKLENKNIRFDILSSKEIDSISDVKNSQGIIAKIKYFDTVTLGSFIKKIKFTKLLILDAVSDPGNMGTIIRTADWFSIGGIILCNNCVEIYNPKVVRSTMGSIFRTPIITCNGINQMFEELKEKGYTIFAADLNGESYDKINYPQRSALVFGNEAHGISENIITFVDKKITIPKKGNAESLNVAVSAGIIISRSVG